MWTQKYFFLLSFAVFNAVNVIFCKFVKLPEIDVKQHDVVALRRVVIRYAEPEKIGLYLI